MAPSPDSARQRAEEWEREKSKQRRRSFGRLFESRAAPFFIAWLVFGALAFCVAFFGVHADVGLSVVVGVFLGLVMALRILLRVRRYGS